MNKEKNIKKMSSSRIFSVKIELAGFEFGNFLLKAGNSAVDLQRTVVFVAIYILMDQPFICILQISWYFIKHRLYNYSL